MGLHENTWYFVLFWHDPVSGEIGIEVRGNPAQDDDEGVT